MSTKVFSLHQGPGPHPGTGSAQGSHGTGSFILPKSDFRIVATSPDRPEEGVSNPLWDKFYKQCNKLAMPESWPSRLARWSFKEIVDAGNGWRGEGVFWHNLTAVSNRGIEGVAKYLIAPFKFMTLHMSRLAVAPWNLPEDFRVPPEYGEQPERIRGVGTYLMLARIKDAMSRGYQFERLYLQSAFTETRPFFEKLGFVELEPEESEKLMPMICEGAALQRLVHLSSQLP